MDESLEDVFLKHVQDVARVAPNMLLAKSLDSIRAALQFAERKPAAAYAVKELRRVFSTSNWLLESKTVESFTQLVGELQFWCMADHCGVPLERIPETDKPTPDFRVAGDGRTPRFEVKTISVKGGWFALDGMSESSFASQLELQQKLNAGAKVASVICESSPHGVVPRDAQITAICRNLIDKVQSNIKPGQYRGAPTCLVVNLLLIDSYYTGNSNLRPISAGYPDPWSVRTGSLWNLAFGRVGHLVHGLPEFEGKPGVEGELEREGVLVNTDNEDVCGLLLVMHPLSKPPAIYGLRRWCDEDKWEREWGQMADAFHALVGSNWNDDRDTNGWALLDP